MKSVKLFTLMLVFVATLTTGVQAVSLYSEDFESYALGTSINTGSPTGPGYSGDAASGAQDILVWDLTSIGDGMGLMGGTHYYNRETTYTHAFTNQAAEGIYTLTFDAYAVNNRAVDCRFGLVDAEGDKLYWRVGYIGASYENHRWELYNGSSIVASLIWGEGIDETVEMKIVVDELTGKFYGEMTYSKGTVATPQYDLSDYDVDNVNGVFGFWRTDTTTSTMYSDMDIDNVSVAFDLTSPVSTQVTASDPAPADGYSAVTSYLVWTAGANAVNHDVYLGASYNEVYNATANTNVYKGRFSQNIFAIANYVDSGASGVFGQWRMDNNGFCWSELDIDNVAVTFKDLTNVIYSEDFEVYPNGMDLNVASPTGPGFTGDAASGAPDVSVADTTSTIGHGNGIKGLEHYWNRETTYTHAFTNPTAMMGTYTLTFDAYAPNNRAAVCGFGLVDAEGDKLYWYVGIVNGQSAWTLVGPSGTVATLPYWDGFDEAVELKIVVNEVTGMFHGQIVRVAGTVTTSEYALGAFGDASGVFGQWRMDNAGFCWSELDIDNIEVTFTDVINVIYSEDFEAYSLGTQINLSSPTGPGYSGDAAAGGQDLLVWDLASIGDGMGLMGGTHCWNRETTYTHAFTNPTAMMGTYTLTFDAYAPNNRAAVCSFGLVDAEGDKLYWYVGIVNGQSAWTLVGPSGTVATLPYWDGFDEAVELKIVVNEVTGMFHGQIVRAAGTVTTSEYALGAFGDASGVFGNWRMDNAGFCWSELDIDNIEVTFTDVINVIYSEDFDSYPLGAQINLSSPAGPGYSGDAAAGGQDILVWDLTSIGDGMGLMGGTHCWNRETTYTHAFTNQAAKGVYTLTFDAYAPNNRAAVCSFGLVDAKGDKLYWYVDIVNGQSAWSLKGPSGTVVTLPYWDGFDEAVELKIVVNELTGKFYGEMTYSGGTETTVESSLGTFGDSLDYGQTYYWRVDEVNGVDIEKGDVWSFVNKRNVIFNSDGEAVFIEADGTELVKLNDWIYDLFRPLEIANVSTLAWADGSNGNTAKYDSSVLEMFGERIGAEDAEIAWEIANGFDPPKVVIEEAHDRGIEVWYSYRMNDIHDSFATSSDPNYDPSYATFKVDNPSWMIGNDAGWPYAYGAKTALKFDVSGVRAIKLAAVTEMLEKYDFDGIEIDWTRHPTCFSPGTESANKGYLTSLMTDIRNELNALAATRGRPITVAVRVDENMEGCTLDGFDIEAWVDNDLIDIIVPGLGAIDVNVADFAALTAGTDVKIYPSLYTPVYRASVPNGIDRAMATNFLYQGADGIESFNCYAHGGQSYVIPMLGEIADAANLVGLDKIYVADSKLDYGAAWYQFFPHEGLQAPLPLTITSSGDVPVLVGEDIDGVYTPVSVKLMVTSNANSSNITSIAINSNSYSPTIIDVNNVEVLTVNAAHVVSGWNTITITVSGSTVIKAVELYVEY